MPAEREPGSQAAEPEAPQPDSQQPVTPKAVTPPPKSRWRRVARLWRRSRALLPMNSDVEVTRTVVGVPVALRIQPQFLALAALGGAAGSGARFILTLVAPTWETLSAGTVAVNLLGPYFLGVLLQSLSEGTETARRRTLRLLIGVGFLGAFTSYAELALDVVTVSENGHLFVAISYAVLTIIGGAAATWFGIFSAHRWRRIQQRRREVTE